MNKMIIAGIIVVVLLVGAVAYMRYSCTGIYGIVYVHKTDLAIGKDVEQRVCRPFWWKPPSNLLVSDNKDNPNSINMNYFLEDLVELSVRLVDASDDERFGDKRSIMATLYEHQAGYDTNNTIFRTIDLLIKHHYIYVLSVQDHPDYQKYKTYFDGLDEYTNIRRNPTEKWNQQDNPEVGAYATDLLKEDGEEYANGQSGFHMYVVAGSEIWQRLVENKTLTGIDAVAPEKLDLVELVYNIMSVALAEGNKRLAGEWYFNGLYNAALHNEIGDFESFKNNTNLKKIRQLVQDNNLLELDALKDQRSSEFKEEAWWFFKEGE